MTSEAWGALRLVDDAATGRVVLFGSLPPEGRDVDLLLSSGDLTRIAGRLEEEGFVGWGSEWARFRDCTVCKLELVTAERWGLPAAEEEALFAGGSTLSGMSKIVEPSPHHVLLLLARRLGRSAFLADKHRAKLERALARDPRAWTEARARAAAWRADRALERLEALYQGEPRRHRRRRVSRPRRSRIISFSGLDGSGKSSQARHLNHVLHRLGFDAFVTWTPAEAIDLSRYVAPVRRLLGMGARSSLQHRENPDFRPTSYPAPVAHAWATVWVVSRVLSFWRILLSHVGRGRVVVCDRYSLDSAVFLEYRHGEKRNFAFQRWLLRSLAPRTFSGYFLDVSPRVALRRKEDQYYLAELERQATIYRSQCGRFGARRLDGEQPSDVLAREIATDVWRKLRRR